MASYIHPPIDLNRSWRLAAVAAIMVTATTKHQSTLGATIVAVLENMFAVPHAGTTAGMMDDQ